jgi:hypothetical protein
MPFTEKPTIILGAFPSGKHEALPEPAKHHDFVG